MVMLIPFFIALAAAALPALLWLFFFTREDRHPEPTDLIAYIFSMGGLISIPTLGVQVLFKHFAPGDAALISLIFLALIEEIFKFAAAYAATHRDQSFDEPVDAMIYTITAALGFATIENFFVIAGSWQSLATLSFDAAIQTAALRFIGATLLHALASGLVGYFWARGILRQTLRSSILTGIATATILHSVFNYLIARFQIENNLLYPTAFLIAIIFIVLINFEKLHATRTPFRVAPPS